MDLEHNLKKNVHAAIEKYKMGVSTDFAVTLCWTPNNQGSMGLAWNIVLIQPSPLLGQKLMQISICAEPVPGEEQVNNVIMGAMEELRTMKAQALSVANGGGK